MSTRKGGRLRPGQRAVGWADAAHAAADPRLSSAMEGVVHDLMARKALKCFCLDFNIVPFAQKPL